MQINDTDFKIKWFSTKQFSSLSFIFFWKINLDFVCAFKFLIQFPMLVEKAQNYQCTKYDRKQSQGLPIVLGLWLRDIDCWKVIVDRHWNFVPCIE